MGISRDKQAKKRPTGAMRAPWHKKRKYAMGRQPSNTKLIVKASTKAKEGAKIRMVRCFGGSLKRRALRLENGNFSWGVPHLTRKARILSVCYNATSNELVRTNTLVKGAVVYIDAAPFAEAIEKAETKPTDETILSQISEGRVLARISSRPGQVGRADGYILEGPELAFYQKKLAAK